MDGLELTVLLGLTILVGALLAPRLRIAAPLLLVVFGLALGFIPEVRAVELPPETVLLLFLPVMLFWESLTTSLRSIRRDFRGIVLMSTLLVVATAFGVAAIAHAFGMPWEAALILGAAIAPPDATAVAALGRTLPPRNFMLLKAESLTNDGTALVLYAIAVGIAMGGSYTPLSVTGLVLLSYVGGIVAGVIVAALAAVTMRRLGDALTINIALLLTPFAAFLLAELIDASGVLAVVVAGLILSFLSARISTASSRRQTEWTWPLGSYLLNGALFVLIGFEVQAVAHAIDGRQIGRLLVLTVAVWLVLLIVRFVFQTLGVATVRLLDRRPTQRRRRMNYRARVVSTVAGFRGAVSLAIALSVPLTLDDGSALPGREAIVFVTAGVIVLTLLVQGPLLPVVVRWARFPDDHTEEKELRLAERAITGAALAAVPELAAEHGISDEVRDLLVKDHYEHLERVNEIVLREEQAALAARLSSDAASVPEVATAEHLDEGLVLLDVMAGSPLTRNEQYSRLKLALIERKREVLIRLRRDGSVDDAVARQVQTRLDVEELRLTGIQSVD